MNEYLNESIIYLHCFTSLTARYLVRLEEQFSGCCQNIFGQRWLSPSP